MDDQRMGFETKPRIRCSRSREGVISISCWPNTSHVPSESGKQPVTVKPGASHSRISRTGVTPMCSSPQVSVRSLRLEKRSAPEEESRQADVCQMRKFSRARVCWSLALSVTVFLASFAWPLRRNEASVASHRTQESGERSSDAEARHPERFPDKVLGGVETETVV
jgi:hypothetical protein